MAGTKGNELYLVYDQEVCETWTFFVTVRISESASGRYIDPGSLVGKESRENCNNTPSMYYLIKSPKSKTFRYVL